MNETRWLTRVDGKETVSAGVAGLKELISHKRLKAEDYVYNPNLQKWIYAKDVEELRGSFSKQGASELNRMAWIFFLFSIVVGLFVSPSAGSVLFIIAIVLAVMYYVKR